MSVMVYESLHALQSMYEMVHVNGCWVVIVCCDPPAVHQVSEQHAGDVQI